MKPAYRDHAYRDVDARERAGKAQGRVRSGARCNRQTQDHASIRSSPPARSLARSRDG